MTFSTRTELTPPMLILARIFELLSATRKLSAAKPHVLSALSGLVLVILLSVFGVVLLAMMISAMLWLSFGQMLVYGASIATAALSVALFTLALLAVTVFVALRVWKSVRGEVIEIFHSQTPVAGKVANVANAFVDGIMTPSGARKLKLK